ncbi:hypothetical protein VIGAN_09162700 [Vigna angularis var. angularis]|uniref:Uncharacterized protein n=1 Tax=Vigna angularis var. angularis TaxID=157739 RepID=A0A0S3SYK8_PHAAN|nr:hypothetical protein VIGAN_09162700 [Vigna angularis var. angularis]
MEHGAAAKNLEEGVKDDRTAWAVGRQAISEFGSGKTHQQLEVVASSNGGGVERLKRALRDLEAAILQEIEASFDEQSDLGRTEAPPRSFENLGEALHTNHPLSFASLARGISRASSIAERSNLSRPRADLKQPFPDSPSVGQRKRVEVKSGKINSSHCGETAERKAKEVMVAELSHMH